MAPAQQASLVRQLALASGSIGMCGGQAIDLASVGHTLTRPQLETMHRMKTGALLRAAVRMGALAGETPHADAQRALARYAAPLELAGRVVAAVTALPTQCPTLVQTRS